jgi:hypothetical protein
VLPADENKSEQIDRLYRRDAEAMALRRASKDAEVYGDVTFRPDIDPVSRELGRSSSLRELHMNRKGQLVRDRASRKVKAAEDAACTFQPNLHAYPARGGRGTAGGTGTGSSVDYGAIRQMGWAEAGLDGADSGGEALAEYARDAAQARDGSGADDSVRYYRQINLKEPERMARDIKQYLKEKEDRRQTELAAREVAELKGCTFQPHIPKPVTAIGVEAAAEPVVVRGIGRHMELRLLNEKLRQDKAEREREVFRVEDVDAYRRLEDGSTIVKPFSLSGQSQRPSRAVLESRAREDSELTFSPVTNEQSRREFVSKLMA